MNNAVIAVIDWTTGTLDENPKSTSHYKMLL